MKPQRYLAAAGLGSRRTCEALIKDGRVTAGGSVVTFNMELEAADDVRVDGRRIGTQSASVYVILNKPAGFISDRGAPGAKSALDLVETSVRLFAVGRLDSDATGLLLLSNDGELTYSLTHPKFEHEKEYRVLVDGEPNAHVLSQWRQGILLEGEDRPTAPAKVRIVKGQPTGGDTWLAIVMREGRKRQIKRVGRALGHPVRALERIRIGPLRLGDLPLGQWRHLTIEEVAALKGEG